MSREKVSAKKGHGSAVELESKSSLFPNHSFHLDSDISLYTPFECQVKCTSNLESALSVTVHRITVQILIAAATVQLLEVKQERKKADEEYLVSLLSY